MRCKYLVLAGERDDVQCDDKELCPLFNDSSDERWALKLGSSNSTLSLGQYLLASQYGRGSIKRNNLWQIRVNLVPLLLRVCTAAAPDEE